MEKQTLSRSARNKARKRAKKEARKALRPKTFYESDRGAAFSFPVRNILAAYNLALSEQYPDKLGVTVWTSVKGARPQVIEVRVLRAIVQHINAKSYDVQNDVRVKISPTSVRIGSGDSIAINS